MRKFIQSLSKVLVFLFIISMYTQKVYPLTNDDEDKLLETIEGLQSQEAVEQVIDAELLEEKSYRTVRKQYSFQAYDGEDIQVQASDVLRNPIDKKKQFDDRAVVDMEIDQSYDFELEVPKDALYTLKFVYQSGDASTLPARFSLLIDGERPFAELNNIILESTWIQSQEKSFDRYGKEIVTLPNKAMMWNQKYLMDSAYRIGSPLILELKEGSHSFSIDMNEGQFYLDQLILSKTEAPYEERSSYNAPGDNLITIQGEDFYASNYSSIHANTEFDTNVEPYNSGETLLNVLDSNSFNKAGHQVTYQLEVEEAGNYMLALNYRQSEKANFPVFIEVLVNGNRPNQALENYALPYATDYRTLTFQDEEKTISFNLEKGINTISLRIKNDPIAEVLDSIEEIMNGVNDLELEITKVAGTNTDKYRDLNIKRYMPDLEKNLKDYAEQLELLEQSLLPFSPSKKNVSVMSSAIVASKILHDLADNIDEITFRMQELSSASNSVNSHLANALDNLLRNSIGIDRIYFYQEDAKLPAKPGFIKSNSMKVGRFISSFFDKSYQAVAPNPEHLQVWVNRSNQHVQVMQKLIDDTFTPETGIKVDISIMPDQYKLVLANSAGNAPDVATGINYTVPYELAIRGALVDLTRFDDLQETTSPYEEGFFLTSTINDGIYAMPETMNFWVQFYRTDILNKLGLKVPNDMNDVIDILPDLQMRGLNYYYPTAGMVQLRNFHGTTPSIIQNGGSLYYEEAVQGTALGSELSVDGFTKLTELFTIYGMPVNVDNFYQRFRNGDLPIGIADYGMFNLLTNAAPELANSWKISLPPGFIDENGNVNRQMCGNAESTVIFKKDDVNRENDAWEFMKWWSSTDAQIMYGQMIQQMFGDEYMWNTANLEAFAELPWKASAKKIIVETAENVVDVARVPGTYMMEREMSNAFNNIAVDGYTAQTRIDQAVKRINREFNRKLLEFGYIDIEGNVLKPYTIPTLEKVREILGREEGSHEN